MNIRNLSKCIAVVLGTAMALPAAALPRLISAGEVKAAKTTYSLFYIDFTKVSLSRATATSTLQARLDAAGEGLTVCVVATDINANNITCGNGLLRMGADFYTTTIGNNLRKPIINWQPVDADTNLDKTSVEYAINLRNNPVVGAPQDTPRVLQFRFNRRVAQFGFVVDPFLLADAALPPEEGRVLDGLQFIVNGQATPVRSFTNELRGNVHFVGVEDPHGFTEVTIIGSGAGFIKPDRYTIVPLSNF